MGAQRVLPRCRHLGKSGGVSTSPRWPAALLCDLGQATELLWASVISAKWTYCYLTEWANEKTLKGPGAVPGTSQVSVNVGCDDSFLCMVNSEGRTAIDPRKLGPRSSSAVQAVWPWASHLISLGLSCFIWEMAFASPPQGSLSGLMEHPVHGMGFSGASLSHWAVGRPLPDDSLSYPGRGSSELLYW